LKKSESGETLEGNNSILVVDASVVTKWFVQEELSDKAIRLRDDYLEGKITIACPDLLGYEVINALRYKPSFGEQDLKTVARALEKYNFLSYSILSNNVASKSIEFALKYGLTIYDASYIAVADYLDRSIVYTADPKLVEKVADAKLVTSISEYGH
jgi:predicted nucleic acid-binding protein